MLVLEIGQVIELNSGKSTRVTVFDSTYPDSTMPWETCDGLWRMYDGTSPCAGWEAQPLGMVDPDELEYDYA